MMTKKDIYISIFAVFVLTIIACVIKSKECVLTPFIIDKQVCIKVIDNNKSLKDLK